MIDVYVWHGNMRQIDNMEISELIALGKKLGLNRRNIAAMLRDIPPIPEQPSFELGPGPYCGGYYGTISIKDF